jgi:hypothetical protein
MLALDYLSHRTVGLLGYISAWCQQCHSRYRVVGVGRFPRRCFYIEDDHADPRQRRVLFLRFDHKGVVILRLTNTMMSNTSPTLSAGA